MKSKKTKEGSFYKGALAKLQAISFRLIAIIAVIGFMSLPLIGCPEDNDDNAGGGSDNNVVPIATPDFTADDISKFSEWLSEQPDNTADTPYWVKLNVDDITDLRTTLNENEDKYVYLDLSGSTITEIPDNAFYVWGSSSCDTLTGITIPDSVTSVGFDAFRDCTSLTSVTIGSGVTTMSGNAFYGCNSLTKITVASGNTAYTAEGGILYNKDKTILVAYPSITGAFTIPDSVTGIGNYAFYGCSSLTEITIPDSVTSVGHNAFSKSSLASVTISDSVTTIGGAAFEGCNSLTEITIPGSVTTIEYSTFSYCTILTSVTIPGSVTTIGQNAFNSCYRLTNVTIPGSVTGIGDYAFYGCSSLTEITIPNSVTTIGYYAFSNCSELTSVTFERNDNTTISYTNAFMGNLVTASGDIGAQNRYGTYTTTAPVSSSSTWTKE